MAPAKRINHFADRGAHAGPAAMSEGVALVGNDIANFADLVDALRAQFSRPAPTMASSVDDAVRLAAWSARDYGREEVIRYIEKLAFPDKKDA